MTKRHSNSHNARKQPRAQHESEPAHKKQTSNKTHHEERPASFAGDLPGDAFRVFLPVPGRAISCMTCVSKIHRAREQESERAMERGSPLPQARASRQASTLGPPSLRAPPSVHARQEENALDEAHFLV